MIGKVGIFVSSEPGKWCFSRLAISSGLSFASCFALEADRLFCAKVSSACGLRLTVKQPVEAVSKQRSFPEPRSQTTRDWYCRSTVFNSMPAWHREKWNARITPSDDFHFPETPFDHIYGESALCVAGLPIPGHHSS